METLIANILLLLPILLLNISVFIIGTDILKLLKRNIELLESIAIDAENIDSLLVQFKGKNNDA